MCISFVGGRVQVDGGPGAGTTWLGGEDLIWTMHYDDMMTLGEDTLCHPTGDMH